MVSDADREAEAAISELLRRERPDDGLLAEEGAEAASESGRRWVIDPLDGTTNFLYGYPAWCVSVALEDAQGPLVGVVHDPLRGETFAARRDGGATLDGAPLRIGSPASLATALVATGFSYSADVRARQADVLRSVLPRVRDIRRGGAAALDLAGVAAGRLDAYFERGLKPWDWCAGTLLVREAGGVVRRLDGEPSGLVAASPTLIEELEALLVEQGAARGAGRHG
jgi:myo-inositol-1(or 4)-monophosphatase